MLVPGYSNYTFLDGIVTNLKSGKELKVTKTSTSPGRLKLKSDEGIWCSISVTKVQALCFPPEIPEGFIPCKKYTGLYVHREGLFWSSPTEQRPLGTMLSIYYPKDTSKYPTISFKLNKVAVHQILAINFIDKDYIRKGLCVMHLDDNKNNFKLSNLKLGTYSENNKAAYNTGANPSKKL